MDESSLVTLELQHGTLAAPTGKKRRRIPKGKLSLRKGARRREDADSGDGSHKRSRSRVEEEVVTEWGDTMDSLYGCRACSYHKDIPSAPTFHPTLEEFRDPFAYVNKIRPQAEKYGICCIVPPEEFRPPFAIDTGANGIGAADFMFHIRKQPTSQLCVRDPIPPASPVYAEDAADEGSAAAASPMDASADAPVEAPAEGLGNTPGDVENTPAGAPHVGRSKYGGARARRAADEPCAVEAAREFGFVTLPDAMSFKQFAVVADWVKERHFRCPTPRANARARPLKRFKCYHYRGPQPSVEQVEAEFWRVVETPDAELISLYGQDIDSGHHGSGFPLPPWRLRMLEERGRADDAHGVNTDMPDGVEGASEGATEENKGEATEGAAATTTAAPEKPKNGRRHRESPEDRRYRFHRWNINNLPRSAGSVLRHVIGDELITGVMVPWLYIGSALSAFCWHIEDHGFYSINYMHMGQPKVWYGVPGHAAAALEEAMRDALPDLFEATPGLAYQLVTLLSPQQLRARGVPVHRIVHHEGSFVITFPNAYHAGFNTGFNCAEAVNFAPPDWIPWGSDLADKYRRDGKPLTLSHDALFVTLVQAARKQHDAAQRASEAPKGGLGLRPRRTDLVSAEEPDADQQELDGVPEEAMRLATGELALRIAEERRRREAGLAACPSIPVQRMQGGRGAVCRTLGHLTDTEDVDCDVCKCDLFLSAVVAPGSRRATCPEHAAAHNDALSEAVFLQRYSLEELDAMVADAVTLVPGAQAAIDDAQQRKAKLAAMCPEVIKLGPVKPVLEKEAAIAARAAKAAARGRGRGRVPGRRPRGRPPKQRVDHTDVVTPPPPTPGADALKGEAIEHAPEQLAIKEENVDAMHTPGAPASAPPTASGRAPSRRRARMTDSQSVSPGPAAKVQAVESGQPAASNGAVVSQSGRPQRLGARRDSVWGNLSALANKGPATRYKPQGTRTSKRMAAAASVAAPSIEAAVTAMEAVPRENATPAEAATAQAMHDVADAAALAPASQEQPQAAPEAAGANAPTPGAALAAAAQMLPSPAADASQQRPGLAAEEELSWDQLLAPDAGSDMQAARPLPAKHASSEEEGGAVVPMSAALQQGLLTGS